ncbi:hypothetical protein [Afipia carboxidovorans]|uniref:hypothetical protein n=1 Tax=Afipia carboxidovorans TaxID=40137 RepID=UPI0030896055|nr:hypothetical protein CRBSH125_05880 [Afipia carboxidovorans]
MTSTQTISVKTSDLPAQPSRQAIQAKTASKPGRVTGKLAVAINLMIEEGTPWDKAATQAGLTVRSMRLAMQRPHVIQHIKVQREVFRAHACAGNIHRLVEMRDQDENKMAVVTAIKTLEQIGEAATVSGGANVSPGLVIVIQNGPQQIANQPQNGDNALIVQGSVSNGD